MMVSDHYITKRVRFDLFWIQLPTYLDCTRLSWHAAEEVENMLFLTDRHHTCVHIDFVCKHFCRFVLFLQRYYEKAVLNFFDSIAYLECTRMSWHAAEVVKNMSFLTYRMHYRPMFISILFVYT